MDETKTTYRIDGSKYHLEPDVRWRQKHAKAGNALAMYNIAWDYMYWHKFGADGEKALLWLKRAADAGNVEACRELSEIYGRGYLELHVFTKCEDIERWPVERDRKLSSRYKERARVMFKALEKPDGRVLYDAGAGWCLFSPDGTTRAHVSCCQTGHFPTAVIKALINRLERAVPMSLYMDSEGSYDLFAEGDIPYGDAFLIHEDLAKRGGPKVRKVRCNAIAMAKQVVRDVESDYYGWATFDYGHDFAVQERRLRKLVSALKKSIALAGKSSGG